MTSKAPIDPRPTGADPGDPRVESAHAAPDPFGPERWSELARDLALDPTQPVCVALSGGADSVYLLRVIAAARERPRVLAVHVDHGLRGAESDADARWCAALCEDLRSEHRVDFALARATLDRDAGGLEARARVARYAALASCARAAGIATIATAHHADDALETLILRWIRGTELAGLAALRPRISLDAGDELAPVLVVRPLLALRRDAIRAALRRAGVAWREDSSNADARFARNAVRNELLPALACACGRRAIDDLHAFERAVADLAARLERRARPIVLAPSPHALARGIDGARGGSVACADLVALGRTAARHALARVFAEAARSIPRDAALERIVDDVFAGRTGRLEVAGGWRVRLRAGRIEIEPPRAEPARDDVPRTLAIPGAVDLGDGRRVVASVVERELDAAVPEDPDCVELDVSDLWRDLRRDLPRELVVRRARPGDRFHALGAPGSKPLARFLADAGVPRADRALVPIVAVASVPDALEIVWVAGIRPSERRRVRADTRERLRLELRQP